MAYPTVTSMKTLRFQSTSSMRNKSLTYLNHLLPKSRKDSRWWMRNVSSTARERC
jgi:hypothetical protein